MNQEQNNLNTNNFNTQGNNGIPNNQPLNNQGMGFNQQPINPQPQPTPSYEQPIMQEPTPQPMNTFESGIANNQSFDSKPPKKTNLGLIIGIVVAVVVVGVGIVFGSKLLSNDGKDNGTNNDSNVNENIDKNETTNNDNDKIQDDYNRYRQIADHNIYVDFKTGRRDSASLNSHVFYGSGEDIVVFVYSGTEYSGSVDGIMDLLNDGSIPLNAIGHTDAKFKTTGNYPINVTKTENIKVGSNDCVKFVGEVTDANGRICFSYGYTFIVDGKACMLVGFVFSESQEKELIDNIKNEIDIMIKTVRTER